MSGQPEALRLADALEGRPGVDTLWVASIELRRLHRRTEDLEVKAASGLESHRELTKRLSACEQQRDALLSELHKARAALQKHLDELIESHTLKYTGLIESPAAQLIIESQQDLINGIDRAIAQAEGHAPT
jgi:uncharacterized protein YhaN